MKSIVRILFLFVLLSGINLPQTALSQNLSADLFELGGKKNKPEEPVVTMTLSPQTAKPGDEVTLSIRISMPPGGYIYSMANGLGGTRTTVDIKNLVGLKPLGDFVADHPPKKLYEEGFKKNVEKYTEAVTWKRTYRILPEADLKKVAIVGNLHYQFCVENKFCTLQDEPVSLTLLEDGEIPAAAEKKPQLHPYSLQMTPTRGKKKKPDPLSLQFALSPKDAKPGEAVTLTVTMQLEGKWHTYAQTQNPDNVGLPIVFKVKNLNGLEPTDGKFTPNHKPETKHIQPGNVEQKVFHGKVTWTQKFKVAADAKPGAYGINGQIRYQVCSTSCLRPFPVKFALGLVQISNTTSSGKPDFTINSHKGLSDTFQFISPVGVTETEGGLLYYLSLAFIGGLIMNIMPCVLPVLAIKVLSFVKQAGESRGKILALNLSYSFGVITVFLILAGLAVGVGMGLGEQFQRPEFNVLMACFIFAMGLSLLGVFEIPVLGLVNNAASGEQKEGLTGAFITGVFATLLATPCAGPFIGPVLAWSVKQESVVTFCVWAMLGVGMASPYLLFGLFPQAVKLLPKPGMWMVRFKEFSGFALMATVIYFIYILEHEFTLTVLLLIMLLGIAMGVWMIGSFYNQTTPVMQKTKIRISAFVITVGICGLGWYGHYLSENALELPWKVFSTQTLQAHRSNNKTILIDFTASWCPNCKVNEAFALNRERTLEFVKKHNVKTLKADYSKFSPEIKAWRNKFGSKTIPLTVIIPANKPNTAIVFRALFSEEELIQTLNMAVELSKKPNPQTASNKQSATE